MYVYIKSEPQLWTAGFYSPDGKWNPESDHESQEKAAERVHWLNGGKTHTQEIDDIKEWLRKFVMKFYLQAEDPTYQKMKKLYTELDEYQRNIGA